MTRARPDYFQIRLSATALAFAAHGRDLVETPAQMGLWDRAVADAVAELAVAVARLPPPEDATYLVVDEDGTFREAQRGQTRETVVEDIATGEYEVEQVFRLAGALCEDVTDEIAAEVLDRLERTGPGLKPFIPALLLERRPMEAETLRRSWMTPAEIKAERDEIDADRARDAWRDLALEAAE